MGRGNMIKVNRSSYRQWSFDRPAGIENNRSGTLNDVDASQTGRIVSAGRVVHWA